MNPTVITLCFLAFAIIMFVLEKIPLGLTATIVSVGLCVTGVLEPKQAFAGYVDSNVILCVAMFVVGQALFETGMANKIGGLVTKFAKSERQLIIAIMVITGLMSGFLSNTGSAAVLIPVVVGIAAESGYSRSHLLMPLVFAAALGGNISIIGAPGNLMGVSALNELGIETSFFEYLIVGGPMMLAGILYFALFSVMLLVPSAISVPPAMTPDPPFSVPMSSAPLPPLAGPLMVMSPPSTRRLPLESSPSPSAFTVILPPVISSTGCLSVVSSVVVLSAASCPGMVGGLPLGALPSGGVCMLLLFGGVISPL